MSRSGENKSEIEQHKARLAELEQELKELEKELDETSKGTLALYNEIDNKNVQLEAGKQALEAKNEELAQALKDLKTSEDARIESARTAAIGAIVVTYNHEINNPLSIILGNTGLIKMRSDSISTEMLEGLEKIERSAKRIQNVVEKISQYETLMQTKYLLDLDMLNVHDDEQEEGSQTEKNGAP